MTHKCPTPKTLFGLVIVGRIFPGLSGTHYTAPAVARGIVCAQVLYTGSVGSRPLEHPACESMKTDFGPAELKN